MASIWQVKPFDMSEREYMTSPVTPMGILLSVIVAGLYGRQRVPLADTTRSTWDSEQSYISMAERALSLIPQKQWRDYHYWLTGSIQRQSNYAASSQQSARDYVAYRTLKEMMK